VKNGSNFYVRLVCSSFVAWSWRSIIYTLLPSYTCWYCVQGSALRRSFLPSCLHQSFCRARLDRTLM